MHPQRGELDFNNIHKKYVSSKSSIKPRAKRSRQSAESSEHIEVKGHDMFGQSVLDASSDYCPTCREWKRKWFEALLGLFELP
jgi:hypothetical protein